MQFAECDLPIKPFLLKSFVFQRSGTAQAAEKALLQTYYRSPSQDAVSRAARRRRKFISTLAQGLRSTPGIEFLGKDRETARLFRYFTTFAHGIAVHRIRAKDALVTIVGIPNATWYDLSAMASLNLAIRHFAGYGHRIVSVPQRAIEALGSPSAPSPAYFFASLIEAALQADLHSDWRCGMRIKHDPTGCLAMRIATGSPCQH